MVSFPWDSIKKLRTYLSSLCPSHVLVFDQEIEIFSKNFSSQSFPSQMLNALNLQPFLLLSVLMKCDLCQVLCRKRLRCSRGSVLAFSTQVRGFKPGRSRRIFKSEKILSTPSFGGEVKPSVSCRRFAACKRSLNGVEVVISVKLLDNILAHSCTFRR